MKFRKKPVVIDAVQFKDNPAAISEISDMAGMDIRVDYADPKHPVLKIETLEGTMIGRVGDWIIRGVKGELYPCRPDIFAETYDRA